MLTDFCKRKFEMTLYSTACNCHNHSDTCVYDQSVADRGLSLDTEGQYRGGGVCVDCKV
jgi:hypothetical protein